MPTVSGRELHKALEVKTAYKDWFPRMCEYGFCEGTDFNPLKFEQVQIEGKREVKREITDHQLTIPMAKELCMLQRNEKGKEFRKYFIKIEEYWNSPIMIMKRALDITVKEKEKIQHELNASKLLIEEKDKRIKEMKPKEIFADSVTTSSSSILIGELAKILKQNGTDIGQKRLFAWLRENGYFIRRNGSEYNLPTQKSMEQQLFEIKETVITHSDGHISVSKTPKVTGKGQIYFVNLFSSGKVEKETAV